MLEPEISSVTDFSSENHDKLNSSPILLKQTSKDSFECLVQHLNSDWKLLYINYFKFCNYPLFTQISAKY